jgi:DNA-directed RNA polymerase subunit RPC12/RpoP
MKTNVLIQGRPGVLTTEHPASAYGHPVLLLDGEVYHPNSALTAGVALVEAIEKTDPTLYTQWHNQVLLACMWLGMRLTCLRCGTQWWPRNTFPSQCPGCGSKAWDRPRSDSTPGPKPDTMMYPAG